MLLGGTLLRRCTHTRASTRRQAPPPPCLLRLQGLVDYAEALVQLLPDPLQVGQAATHRSRLQGISTRQLPPCRQLRVL